MLHAGPRELNAGPRALDAAPRALDTAPLQRTKLLLRSRLCPSCRRDGAQRRENRVGKIRGATRLDSTSRAGP